MPGQLSKYGILAKWERPGQRQRPYFDKIPIQWQSGERNRLKRDFTRSEVALATFDLLRPTDRSSVGHQEYSSGLAKKPVICTFLPHPLSRKGRNHGVVSHTELSECFV
jgi:hypothetical protein